MNIKKVFVSALIIVLIFFSFVNISFADNEEEKKEETTEITETIENDDGGMFEKIIAKMIRRYCTNSI